VPPEPVTDLLGVGGVRDQQVTFGGKGVDVDVVHDAAFGVADGGVVALAGLQPGHVVGADAAQEGRRLRAGQLEAAHVGDVEHAGGGAHGGVLLDDADVLDGHLPAGEGHHARAQANVLLVEAGAAEGAGGGVSAH